ncbi:hypothetical protein KGO95_03195 [Patescibacteria group bacterium]|nr:hypothetical protein [Patescibacteria group bacterium]
MITAFLTIFFTAGLLFFGYVFTVFVLDERRIFAAVPLSAVIGFGAYVFFLNAVSYFVPVGISFFAVFYALLAVALGIYFFRRKDPDRLTLGGLTSRQLKMILIIAALISMVSGIVAVRTLELDDMSLTHLSLASTIAQGNFPVMDPSAPDHPMGYHYAPDLLVAATGQVVGLPLWLGYDYQTFLFSGLTFLLAFVLAWYLSASYLGSLLAALFFTYGGGLLWLNFTAGISPLWQKFVLHQNVFAPWKFLWFMTYPRLNTSFIYAMNNHSIALGTPVMLLALYAYFRALEFRGWKSVKFLTLAGLLFGYLALSVETNFAVLLAGFFCVLAAVTAVHVLQMRGKFSGIELPGGKKTLFIFTGIVSTVGLGIAFYQGGIFSTLGSGGAHTFGLATKFWEIGFNGGTTTILSWEFLKEFGFPFILFFPAVLFYRKDKKILFLGLLAAIAFSVPFIVHYVSRPWEMNRFFAMATPLFAFIVGLYLGNKLEAPGRTRRSKVVLWSVGALVILSGVMFQAVSVLTPFGSIGKFDQPLLAMPPAPSSADQPAYAWIEKNTTIKDRFFPFSVDFIRDTGRFTPGYFENGEINTYPNEIAAYDAIMNSCSARALEQLNIDYVYISSFTPNGNLSVDCLNQLKANLVYQGDGGEGETSKIYRVSYNRP